MPPTRQLILTGDSRDLRAIEPESIALVVTSPPYPMIAMWDDSFCAMNPEVRSALDTENGELAFGLMHRELDRVWREVWRVLVPGGIACVNVGDATRTLGGLFRLYSNHVRILHTLERRGLHSLPHILWRKQTNAPNKFMGSGMLPPGAYVTLEHEHILVLRKEGPRELTSPEQKARRRRSAFFWEERNVWFSDVWDFKGARQSLGASSSRERSGAFPFELAYRLVAMFSIQGDTVLDPFAGTGTMILACAALGRNGVGVEIDPAMAEDSRRRLAGATPELNEWTHERLERHREFVRQRAASGKELKHANAHHGFPVVTGQEADLAIDSIRRISAGEEGDHRVEYSPTEAGQISLDLPPKESP